MHKETLEAIEKISAQLDGYKKELADKANTEQFDSISDKLESLEKGFNEMSEKELDKSLEEINGTVKNLLDQVAEMREEQAKLKEKGAEGRKAKGMYTQKEFTEKVKALIDGKVEKDENGHPLYKKPTIKLPNLATAVNKAPETFGFNQTFNGDGTGVQIDAFTGREVDPILYQRIRKRNLILDHIPITSIEVPKLYYLEKEEVGDDNETAGDPGSADWITSGASKPQRSFRLKTGEVEAKKVAIYGNIEDKLLRDVASMENWIREDLMDEITEEFNNGLLNNDPAVTPDAPLGMKTNAVTFTATPAFDGSFANGTSNEIDAIIASAAFMSDNKEVPVKVFVSNDVFYRIHNLKATDGKYLNNNLIYVNQVGQLFIAGVEVVGVDSEDVPSTHLLMISADLGFKIRTYGSMVFERGLNGNDFREDKTSYRGFQEVLSYIAEQRENSVLYDTFANIATDIEAAS